MVRSSMKGSILGCNESKEEIEEDEEILLEPKKGKNPEISLHPMEGNSSPTTIRLMGQVNNKPVSTLLDSRSTHNFIGPRVVYRTGLYM